MKFIYDNQQPILNLSSSADATQLINTGYSLKEIADILGHMRLDTTTIYAKVNMTTLREVADMNWEDLL